MSEREPVPRAVPDLVDEQVAHLREIFPEAFSEGRVDFERLRAALGEIVDDGPERYSFTWSGKREAMRQLQRPSWATLVPDRDESVNFDDTDNIFIEGENLEVLKLLYKSYFGRVKMIYIDPPYNTGNDFVYPDSFAEPMDTYLRVTGQRDDEGNLLTTNPETSGRYHSAWLSMMYPRLFVARQLLREDGVIFISIDDREVHNLRLLMNEVFGEEAFANCVVWRRGVKSVQAQFDTIDALATGHEYVVMYKKRDDARFAHLELPLDEPKPGTWNNHWRGTDRPTMRYELLGVTPRTGQWRWSEERSLTAVANYQRLLGELGYGDSDFPPQTEIDDWWHRATLEAGADIDLLRLSRNGKPEHYVPPSDTRLGSDLWTDLSPRGSAELDALFGSNPFHNPKPTPLVRRMLSFATDAAASDMVLDFFAGSCTTAQAVLEHNREDGGNRRFIMVQLPEPLANTQTLDDGTQLATIADIGKERIRRVIARLEEDNAGRLDVEERETPEDLGFRVFKLAESNLRPWREVDLEQDGAPDAVTEQLQRRIDPLREGWSEEAVIAEVALKEGFGLNCRVEEIAELTANSVYRVTDPEREQAFYICLDDEMAEATWRSLDLTEGDLLICRDVALDDTKLANLALQCRLHTI